MEDHGIVLSLDGVDAAWLEAVARANGRSVEMEAISILHEQLERIADDALDVHSTPIGPIGHC